MLRTIGRLIWVFISFVLASLIATFVLVTLGATVFFHEPVSWQKVLGLGVILAGIVLVART